MEELQNWRRLEQVMDRKNHDEHADCEFDGDIAKHEAVQRVGPISQMWVPLFLGARMAWRGVARAMINYDYGVR